MTPANLQILLHSVRAPDPVRSALCPNDHTLAAYVDGALAESAREAFESHLSECDYCLTVVGALSHERTGAADTFDSVRPHQTDTSLHATSPSPPPATVRRVPHWAVAASVLIAVGLLVRFSTVDGPGQSAATPSDARTTRATASSVPPLTLLSPRAGEAVRENQLVVRWTPVAGSKYYDVRVVTDSGDVVAEEHVRGTEWRPTDLSHLQSGSEYFVHVDAYIADDKSVSSQHVAFRLAK